MSQDTGGGVDARVVSLPDGRRLHDGDLFSYGEDDRGRTMLYEAAFSAGLFEARPVGGWADAGQDVVFDEKIAFVNWCTTPTPPVDIGVEKPKPSLVERLKRILGLGD